MTTTLTNGLTMKIGRKTYNIGTIEAASELFCAARDKMGIGASRAPTPLLYRDGALVGYVSYNGRVWAGDPKQWKPDAQSLYTPPSWVAAS